MITVNINKAKEYVHDIRRKKRAEEFEPHDNIIMKQIPGNDFQNAEAERQKIRKKYNELQKLIDNTNNLKQLESIINSINS